MARTINRVELLGRVGVEPEMKYTQSGTAVTQLRLATDRRRQNGDSETDWHGITCWGKTAEVVNQFVGKGDRIFVAGRLSYSSYETFRRTAPIPHRDPRKRGHLPRLSRKRQRQGRRGRAGRGRELALLAAARTPSSGRSGRSTGPLPHSV